MSLSTLSNHPSREELWDNIPEDWKNCSLLKRLLDTDFDPNTMNKGTTLLFEAAFNGNISLIKYILTFSPDINKGCVDGHTPLDAADTGNNPEEVVVLIRANGGMSREALRQFQPAVDAALERFRQHLEQVEQPFHTPFEMACENECTITNTDECCICMEALGKKNTVITACGHQFHLGCLSQNMVNSETCPICRAVIIPDYL